MNDRTMGVSDPLDVTRRYFLGRGAAVGVGAMALSSLLGKHAGYPEAGASDNVPHFAPKAKRVIFLTQSGGPSQLELYDHKPGLVDLAGQKLPDSVRNGQVVRHDQGKTTVGHAAAFGFSTVGRSGRDGKRMVASYWWNFR